MKRKLYLSLCTILCCLSSCYTDLNLEKYRPDPKVVLNSVVSPDTIVMASVSRTVFFPDPDKSNIGINDADVDLYVNQTFYQKMKWTSDTSLVNKGMYTSSYTPKTGDHIKVVANTSLGTAWAEDILPELVPIEDIKISYITTDDPLTTIVKPDGSMGYGYKHIITYSITFTDDAAMRNFYCIRIDNAPFTLDLIDYSRDPVFIAQQSIIDGSASDNLIEGKGGRTFTDDLINGKTYTMTIREIVRTTSPDFIKDLSRDFYLYAVSESYYKYLTGVLNVEDQSITGSLTDFGFAEPKYHFNNINGGVGILGTVQTSHQKIEFKDIFPEQGE